MTIELYVDLRSQPCRALLMFLKLSEIPHQVKYVDLFKGEHKTQKFSDKIPLQTVPAMTDGDFVLCETVAIFRYLTSKYKGKFADNWYPADIKKRAKVDEYMAFHHGGTRGVCVPLFVSEVLIPMSTGKPVDADKVKEQVEKLNASLEKIEKNFLKDNQYLCGDEASFADIEAACEFMQFVVNARDILGGRPLLKAYLERVKTRLNPVFDEVNSKLYEWRDNYKK